jgi:hypothetical protein
LSAEQRGCWADRFFPKKQFSSQERVGKAAETASSHVNPADKKIARLKGEAQRHFQMKNLLQLESKSRISPFLRRSKVATDMCLMCTPQPLLNQLRHSTSPEQHYLSQKRVLVFFPSLDCTHFAVFSFLIYRQRRYFKSSVLFLEYFFCKCFF